MPPFRGARFGRIVLRVRLRSDRHVAKFRIKKGELLMENATKRLRKARRQGLSTGGDAARIAGRAVSIGATRSADLPYEPSPGERRKSTLTQRKMK